jgi:hypothetical protein
MKTPILAAILLTLTAGPALASGPFTYLGQQHVPTGTLFGGTTVGGLSALDYDAANQRYFAISDDRSGFNPARFYTFTLDLAQFTRSAAPGNAGVAFTGVTTILTPLGLPYAGNGVDPEGLRYDAARNRIYWSNEGDRATTAVPPRLQDPTVREMTLAGTDVRGFAVPASYGVSDPAKGIRLNLAFESLSLSPDGNTLWTATENALVQDGPAATLGNGSPSRVMAFDVASGAAGAQYLYNVAPVVLPPAAPGLFATNGLTDFLAIGDREFITIERSFAAGAATPGVGPNGLPTGNTIRLYYADARGATDVSGLDSIAGQAVVPMSKTLLLDLSTLTNDDGSALATDNIEGLTWGPERNGNRTLILVSDNNFGATQFTQFVALEVTSPIPEPGTLAMLLGGGGLLGLVVRRRSGR